MALLNYTVASDGIYYVHVQAARDLGLRAQYFLNVKVVDGVAAQDHLDHARRSAGYDLDGRHRPVHRQLLRGHGSGNRQQHRQPEPGRHR